MNPTPLTVVGPSANAATTARVCAMSGMSRRSNSPPRSPRVPCTLNPDARSSTVAPIARKMSTKWASPCTESRCSPGTVTRPPQIAAAAKKYDAADASGSTVRVAGRYAAGGTRHPLPVASTTTPRAAIDGVPALPEGQRGEKKPRGGARQPGIEEHGPGLERSAADEQRVAVGAHVAPEPAQTLDHRLGVIGIEGADDGGFPFREGGTDERPVGDRLRPGHHHDGVDRARERLDGPHGRVAGGAHSKRRNDGR